MHDELCSSSLVLQLVVDFWATWCKPCVEIAPFFEELSARFPAVVFARVDVDELEVRCLSVGLAAQLFAWSAWRRPMLVNGTKLTCVWWSRCCCCRL
jgi:thiol-disulfide isomerase/thioredoxin